MQDTPLAEHPTLLLDLDGTIADSRPGILAGYRHTLGIDTSELDWTIGPPMKEVMARLLATRDADRIDGAVAAYRAYYSEIGLYDASLYPGMTATLDALRAACVTLHIVTSKRTVFARRLLAHFGIDGLFASINGSEPDGSVDHKTDLLKRVLDHERLDPARCAMVGDRHHDIEAARANGVRAVGVAWGYGTRDELIGAGAAMILETPADLTCML